MGEDAATNDEPFARLADTDHWGRQLGIEFLEVGPERVRARLDAGRRHQQPYGILHGGVCTSDGTLVARGQVRFQVLDQLPDERRR